MMNRLFLFAILLAISAFLLGNLLLPDKPDFEYSHTKAVCEGRECQDFLIVCSDSGLVEMTPLTGLVTFSDGWKDPRNEEEKELC